MSSTEGKSRTMLPLLKTLIGSPANIDLVNRNNANSGRPYSLRGQIDCDIKWMRSAQHVPLAFPGNGKNSI